MIHQSHAIAWESHYVHPVCLFEISHVSIHKTKHNASRFLPAKVLWLPALLESSYGMAAYATTDPQQMWVACKDTNKQVNYQINSHLFSVSSESIFENTALLCTQSIGVVACKLQAVSHEGCPHCEHDDLYKSITLAFNCLSVSLLSKVMLLSKVSPTITTPKQVVLVWKKRHFKMEERPSTTAKQVVLLS